MALVRNRPVRHFENVHGTSRKFWEIMQKGTDVVTCWGRIGSVGRISIKRCSTVLQANLEFQKLVDSKVAKGYNEGTGIPF